MSVVRRPAARTVLFVAAFDSQLKWCGLLRDEFARRGFSWRAVVPDVRSALSDDQTAAAGFAGTERLSWPDLLRVARSSEVVVSALSGPLTQGLFFELGDLCGDQRGDRRRPLLVSGWVGVIIEKITAGYLDRSAADVIAVNARSDLDHFLDVARRLDLPRDNLLLSGLPLLGAEPAPPGAGPIQQVLYADQPTVPGPLDERRYVYDRLLDYARRHPDRRVLLRPRHRPGEDTFHRMQHHPEHVLADRPWPVNFSVDYTPITQLLPRTDVLLTMSSTAALEALHHGVRVGLVLDLGVHERYGNHVFLDSGLLRTFAQIGADDLGTPDPDFLRSYFLGRDRSPAAQVADRVDHLLATGERPGRVVERSAYHRAAADFQREVMVRRRDRLRPAGRPLRSHLARVGRSLLPPVLARPLRRAMSR